MNPAKTDVASSINIVICLGKVRQMLLIRQSLGEPSREHER